MYLFQQIKPCQMKACGPASCLYGLWTQQLSNSAEGSGALRDLSLNPEENSVFHQRKQKWEQRLIVYTSTVADKIRPAMPNQRPASSVQPLPKTRHWAGQRGQFLSEEGCSLEVEDTISIPESWTGQQRAQMATYIYVEQVWRLYMLSGREGILLSVIFCIHCIV